MIGRASLEATSAKATFFKLEEKARFNILSDVTPCVTLTFNMPKKAQKVDPEKEAALRKQQINELRHELLVILKMRMHSFL